MQFIDNAPELILRKDWHGTIHGLVNLPLLWIRTTQEEGRAGRNRAGNLQAERIKNLHRRHPVAASELASKDDYAFFAPDEF
jgi:hypothetical protein